MLGRSFVVADLSDPCLVTADPEIAAGLSVAARSDLVVVVAAAGFAVDSVAADLAFDPGCSVCPVYSVCLFAAVTEKGTAVLVASCSSVLRFFFLRTRSCPSPLCFVDRV